MMRLYNNRKHVSIPIAVQRNRGISFNHYLNQLPIEWNIRLKKVR